MIPTRPRSEFDLIFITFALSACRVLVDTQLNKDSSGELRTSIVFSAEEKRKFESSAGNAGKSICDNLKKDATPEATFLQEEGGNRRMLWQTNTKTGIRPRGYTESWLLVRMLA